MDCSEERTIQPTPTAHASRWAQPALGNQAMQHFLRAQAAPASTNQPGLRYHQGNDDPTSPVAASVSPTDKRIDVRAKFALQRLLKSSDAAGAAALIQDIESGRLNGIFGDDLGVAAKRAAERGTVRWKLVPPGQDAIVLNDGLPGAPVLLFKEAAGGKPRLDRALIEAHGGTVGGPPPQTKPTFSATGNPTTQAPVTVFRDGGNLDTHAHFPQIRWPAQVTMTGASPDCFEVGFFQNVNTSVAGGFYSRGNGLLPGICFFVLPVPPAIRDGASRNFVWFRSNSFSTLGTCRIVPEDFPLPPGISPVVTNTVANVSMTDDPGGPFPIRHPNHSTKRLKKIIERHVFHTWLAVRPKSAPENDVGSYIFLKNAQWVVRRTIDITHSSSGEVGFFFRKNETRVTALGNGQGTVTPVVSKAIANEESGRVCLP